MSVRLRALQGACAVVGAALLASLPAWAQHAPSTPSHRPAADRPDHRPPHLVVAGYTTPGSTLPLRTATPDSRPLGGTIYFAVFHNTARAGDAFGDTFGVRDGFDTGFVPAPKGPALDVSAQFLYLYQLVNDRAFHDPETAPAQGSVVPAGSDGPSGAATADIADFVLALFCEPRQITSWGHFKASAFTIRPGSQDTADPPHSTTHRLAMSAHPAVAQALPAKQYRPWPAKRLLDVAGLEFALGGDRAGLDSLAWRIDRDGGVRFAAFAETVKKGGIAPDLVDVAVEQGPLHGLPGVSGRRAVFRAGWRGTPLTEGRHSVVFGYTSNLPPMDTIGVITEPKPAIVAPVQPSAAIWIGACPPVCCAPAVSVAPPPASRFVPSSGIPTPGDHGGFAGGNRGGSASTFRGNSVGGPGLGLFASFPGGFGGPPGGGGGGGGGPNDPGNPRNGPPGDGPPGSNPPGNTPPGGPRVGDPPDDPPGGDPPGDGPPGGDDPPGADPPFVAPAPASFVLGILGIPAVWYLSRRRRRNRGSSE